MARSLYVPRFPSVQPHITCSNKWVPTSPIHFSVTARSLKKPHSFLEKIRTFSRFSTRAFDAQSSGKVADECEKIVPVNDNGSFSSGGDMEKYPSGEFLFEKYNLWDSFAVKLKMLIAWPWERAEKGSVLTMKIRGEVSDQLKSRFSSGLSLPQICENFIKAAYDPRISGIYLHIESLNCGWGKVEEIWRHVHSRKSRHSLGLLSRFVGTQYHIDDPISKFFGKRERTLFDSRSGVEHKSGCVLSSISTNWSGMTHLGFSNERSLFMSHILMSQNAANFCSLSEHGTPNELLDTTVALSSVNTSRKMEEFQVAEYLTNCVDEPKAKSMSLKSVDFTKIHIDKLPTVVLIGRPNVGKSALFNRLIRRREALVYNTPNDHVTRDIREGVAKLGDLRFRVLDSAGLEAEASSGSVLGRTAAMTGNVLERVQFALFLIDARDGLQPMDLDVGKWLRKQATGIKTLVVMNKAELLDEITGSLAAAAGEAYRLGFGDPIALSAETGLGMTALHEALRPLLEDYVFNALHDEDIQDNGFSENVDIDSKLPLQLAIVGRPNVGKSTLLNSLLQENRVLVGPEAGLTRDSIRVQFQYEGRNIYLVDTAGWLERTKQEKGPSSLSIMQSRKHLMRAHVVALVLDAEEIARAKRSMKHAEVVIARRAVEEGRGLVVVVNKMDLLKGKRNYESVINAVPEEIQTLIPQVTGIPVVFVSALQGKGRMSVMRQVVETYERWCLRLPTARLNRWLRKVMSRHSWKDHAAQPKIKYFTQVKARPPTFVAFVSGKIQLSETDLRFLTRSLKEDFDMGGIPVRITQRNVARNSGSRSIITKNPQTSRRGTERMVSDKRSTVALENTVPAL